MNECIHSLPMSFSFSLGTVLNPNFGKKVTIGASLRSKPYLTHPVLSIAVKSSLIASFNNLLNSIDSNESASFSPLSSALT